MLRLPSVISWYRCGTRASPNESHSAGKHLFERDLHRRASARTLIQTVQNLCIENFVDFQVIWGLRYQPQF